VKQVWAIVRKDLALERRSREMFGSTTLYALLVLLLFGISFDLRVGRAAAVAPGVLWVAISFSGMLGLARSFVLERDQGCLDGLLLCPIDRSQLYLAKVVSNLIFLSITEVILVPLYLVLLNLPFDPLLPLVVLLGTIGFSAVGTLLSALTAKIRAREALLPVLVFPILLPALIAAVKLTAALLDNLGWEEMRPWLLLLVGFDVLFVALSYTLFDAVVEE
jgi:heme exporter protein B